MQWDLEELAREALERADVGAPVDPEDIVISEGLKVLDGGPGCDGYLVGRKIYADDALRRERRAFLISHELGHWIGKKYGPARGVRDSEQTANYIASALLLPKLEIERDLRRGWDLIRICARHRWASFEAVARRIVALREARAVVFDRPLAGQRPPSWYTVPYGGRPTDLELDAAREAASCGAPVAITPAITAWPVIEHDWARVITVASL
jgi:hypothetical protein